MRIVIPDDYQDVIGQLACFDLLRGHEVVRFRQPAADLDELVARLDGAEVVVAVRERVTFSRALLERLPSLRLIALVGRTASTIDHAACDDLGIGVATGHSGSIVAPAELTVALILAARRNIALEAARMQRGEWPTTLSHRLRGSTLGICGFGKIGAMVAEAGRGLGMHILAWGREESGRRAQAAGVPFTTDRARLFAESDVLSLHLRLGPATRGLIGPADLALMKPTALLVNTARAELIAPGALLGALQAGRPGYAAVDVYEEEPVMHGDHPLLRLPNVLCVPHLGWAEWECFEQYFGETFAEIVTFAAGGRPRLANPDVVIRA